MTTTSGAGCGCPEFRLSRRRFLATTGAAAGVMTAGSLFGDAFRQVAYGATTGGNVVVVLSCRGGADGLSLVVPRHADDRQLLDKLRPSIAVPDASLVGADADFGLHPELAPLAPMWQGGSFGAVHAVGLPAPNRSHFDAMEVLEDADPGSSGRSGWINRMIGLDSTALPESAVQLGSPLLPTSLVGAAPTLGAYDLASLSVKDFGAGAAARREALRQAWAPNSSALGESMRSTLATAERLEPVAQAADPDASGGSSVHVDTYPKGPL